MLRKYQNVPSLWQGARVSMGWRPRHCDPRGLTSCPYAHSSYPGRREAVGWRGVLRFTSESSANAGSDQEEVSGYVWAEVVRLKSHERSSKKKIEKRGGMM